MSIWKLIDNVKQLVTYDADKEFYAMVFPDSVRRQDLMRIRKLWVEDLPRIVEIEGQNYNYPWSEEVFKSCIESPNYSCWICEEQGMVIGYSILSMAVGEAHIMNICVDSTIQNQGVGGKLLDHSIEVARAKAETIMLEVRPSNKVAIALYEKRGFNEIGRRKGYYPAEKGAREDAIMLALDLVSLF